MNAVPVAATGEPFACGDLWPDSDRLKDTGLADCLEYESRTINGSEYRVVYPSEWATEFGWGSRYLAPTMQAMQDSVDVFGKLGGMGSVTIVFSLHANPINALVMADAGLVDFVSTEPCAVVVYPIASIKTEEHYQQAIAHEMFHCFQDWNFDPQKHAEKGYDWWVEGTAEYFGNVVYPSANYEWRMIPYFDDRSPWARLTQMAYENVVFWQYLGNEIGNDGILKLIGTLPTSGGEAEQQAALRAYPGFAELFQGFAQAYLDKNIADTSGAMLPLHPVIKPVSPAIAASTSLPLKTKPFVVFRYAPVFAPDVSFTVNTAPADSARSATRPLQSAGEWETPSTSIGCGDPLEYVIAVTSIAAGKSSAVAATVNVTAGDEPCEPDPAQAESDPCLIGTWAVAEYQAAILGSYAATNAQVDLVFVDGSGALSYTFDGEMVTLTAEAFEIRVAAEIAGMVADITIVMNGETSAPYNTDPGNSSGIVWETPSALSIVVTVLLDGDPVSSTEVPELWRIVGGPFQYACTADTLDLVVPGPGGQMLPPLVLTREA